MKERAGEREINLVPTMVPDIKYTKNSYYKKNNQLKLGGANAVILRYLDTNWAIFSQLSVSVCEGMTHLLL